MSTMTADIEVSVDPEAAFAAFTEEWDQWWGNGPIDSHQSWRLIERRMEPGVGGRLVEDYGDEQRVLGTITAWEPGARLAWTTDNDVTIEVEFSACEHGTRVTVCGSVPEGVNGRADLSVVRVAPQWFPRHLQRRAAGKERAELGQLHVGLRSATPAATARWLANAFQLECKGDIPETEGDPTYTWIEFRVGNGLIVVWGDGGGGGDASAAQAASDSPIVYVDDLDAHLAHASSAGATIVAPISDDGMRSYTAADCEGRRWVFAQSGPRIGR